MAQHTRVNSSGQDSVVHLHLKERNHSFEDNNVKNLGLKGQIVWKWNKIIHLCPTDDYLWTEEQAFDIIYHPPTMQRWVPSPDTLTAIHTWAHLALATNMKPGWIKDP